MLKVLTRKSRSALRLATRHARKRWWQLRHGGAPGSAAPLFILGAQRSGTTMLGDCLDASAQVAYYPEHHRVAFDDFVLREDVWPTLVARSRLPIVAFKPLTSSHTAASMLERYASGRVVWALRHPSDRARSAVAKFGEQNLRLLTRLASGDRPDVWQTRGFTKQHFALVESLMSTPLDAAGAAAVFWYLRNDLYFTQGLGDEPRAQIICYERLVSQPVAQMEQLCAHLQIPFEARLAATIHARSVRCDWPDGTREDIRTLCDELYRRMEALAL